MRFWGALTLLVALAGLVGCGSETLTLRPGFLAASTDLVDFGEVFIGQEETRSVFLINTGEKPVSLIKGSGGVGAPFAVVITDWEVEGNQDLVVEVLFSPSEVLSYETLALFDNDSYNAPDLSVTLRGSGKSTDPCFGLDCNNAPDSVCLTSASSRNYVPTGTCLEGECVFEEHDEVCDWGCDFDTGYCKEEPVDPCFGVVCQDPPNVCFLTTGTCVDGACLYTADNGITCTDNDLCTENDTCIEGACRTTQKVCDSPEPDYCWGPVTLRRYEPTGVCNTFNGLCQYGFVDVYCDFGCTDGACEGDPCAGGCNDNNPCTFDECNPASGCQYTPQAGSCLANDNDCPTGQCSGGACLPQQGVICEAEYDVDLCQSATVAGVCTGSGDCVVEDIPPEYQCPNCNGICLECYIIQVCIPIF